MRLALAGTAALVLALGAVLWGWSRRLRRLSRAMERYLAGEGAPVDLSLREDAVAPVENAAAELCRRVEVLDERLGQERERARRLMANISHQLKTPLASLRLFCELDQSSHVDRQLGQVQRMEDLISGLLRLERLSADGYTFRFAVQPVRPLAERAWEALRPMYPEKQVEIRGDAVLSCDGRWLREALQNLLKNACEHTAPAGRIWVRAEETERMFYCAVEDDGGGVGERDLPHLFERFYRGADRPAAGSGLGLAIVREIVERHHGHVSARNTPSGLRVEMAIPIFNLAKT